MFEYKEECAKSAHTLEVRSIGLKNIMCTDKINYTLAAIRCI